MAYLLIPSIYIKKNEIAQIPGITDKNYNIGLIKILKNNNIKEAGDIAKQNLKTKGKKIY